MSMVVVLIPFLSSFSSSLGGSWGSGVGAVGGVGAGILLLVPMPFTRATVRAIAVFICRDQSFKLRKARQ